MKKFVLMTVGFTPPTPKMMKQWNHWFKSLKGQLIDQIGLDNGRDVKEHGIKHLPMDREAITGLVLLHAKDINEATKIARNSPMITSTRVYEVR
ncbi:MAG: hypothetical protein ACXACA_01615 [Candidatus Ranarchaeia archaeon]|jgi:hypothetical protein